ncbi:MAG: TRAM domain-containing protein, partial [Fimbriimonadaceae bacterium]
TLAAMRRFRFDGAFMFRYSPRPGTPAAEMPQVDRMTAAERLHRLIELQNSITDEINAGLVGREFEVLVEGPSPKDKSVWQGYTRCFRMVHFAAGRDLAGRTVRVRATAPRRWGLVAEMV